MIESLPVESMLTKARRNGGDLAEVFVESSHSTTIICDDNRLEKISTASDTGLGLRVLHDTRTAYGSTNDLSEKTLNDLATSVGTAAAKKGKAQRIAIFSGSGHAHAQQIKNHPSGISLDKKTKLVTRANEIARTADERIVQVRVMLRDSMRRIWVVSSDGTNVADEQTHLLFVVHVVCKAGDVLQSGYESVGGMKGYELFDETAPEEIAAIAAKRALTILEAAPAPTGPMPVVIAGTAGGTMIHEAVGHGLEADLTGEGLSVYRDRLGEMVANPLISVYDDGTLPGNRGSFTYDDEGTPAQRTCLIENGVLKGFLQNRVSATRTNAQPTGNGRRQNYAHPPIVRMTNTLIAPRTGKLEDIVRATDRGLFVKKMGGGQVNTVNGDFVFDVQEGYRIENGAIGEPVRGATLTGNGPKILEMIDMVGDDLGFSIGTCGKNGQEAPVSSGQPTLRIPEIIVGGQG